MEMMRSSDHLHTIEMRVTNECLLYGLQGVVVERASAEDDGRECVDLLADVGDLQTRYTRVHVNARQI